MDSKQLIRLPDSIISRCREHGEHVVKDYASGLNARSRSVSSRGAESNPELQAIAKMAECAFAMWIGVSIELLNWGGYADPGWDVKLNRLRFDVKNTLMRNRLLIWPLNKSDFYDAKQFDVMVLVKQAVPEFLVHKWISKKDFKTGRLVAPDDGYLDPGTWYMDSEKLYDMVDLWGYFKLMGWR